MKKNMPKRFARMRVCLTLPVLLFLFSVALSVHANTITVDSGGSCTIDDAVDAADDNVAVGNCPAGSAVIPDVIILETDVDPTGTLIVSTNVIFDCDGHTINKTPVNLQHVILITGSSPDVIINDCTISGGAAAGNNGGAIHVAVNGVLHLNNSTLTNNTAARGAGLYVQRGGTAYVNGSTVTGNTATIGGGGITVNHGTLTLTNSTVSGNLVGDGGDDWGGGVMIFYFADNNGTTIIENTTITDNESDEGGGVYVLDDIPGDADDGTVILRRSLIAGNRGINNNEGHEIRSPAAGYITADNYNLFADNSRTNATAFHNFTPGSSDHVATSDGQNNALNTILDSTLAYNGGYSLNHALVTGSPALDLVTDCTVATDQRYYGRPNVPTCDAGSYEFTAVSSPCVARYLPATTWYMTASPCVPTPADVDTQLSSDLHGTYGVHWISYDWNTAVSPAEYHQMAGTDPFVQGDGYWDYSLYAGNMRITGTPTPVEDCATYYGFSGDCFVIDLIIPVADGAEWNMLGHPFPYPVLWPDVRIAAGNGTLGSANWTLYAPDDADEYVASTYYRYTGSTYESFNDSTPGMIGTLQPQDGFWLQSVNPAPAHAHSHIRLLIPEYSHTIGR